MKKILIQAISFMAFIFVTTFEAECKNDVDLVEAGKCLDQCILEFNSICKRIMSSSVRRENSKPLSIKSCAETPIMTLKNCLQKC